MISDNKKYAQLPPLDSGDQVRIIAQILGSWHFRRY